MEDFTFDVVIVGAGPAGIGAAVTASRSGKSVAVLDDNVDIGGQIWRGERTRPLTREAQHWFDEVRRARNVQWWCECAVLGVEGPKQLLVHDRSRQQLCRINYQSLILATGAVELFLPISGWTLPGVFGAGGLQALAKSGYSVCDKRVIVAGSGPLLLAVAAYLQSRGAQLMLVAEQAPWSRVYGYALHLLVYQYTKFRHGVSLRRTLRKTPYRVGCWPVRIRSTENGLQVIFTDGVKYFSESCDLLACGFGLVPNTELAQLIGCRLEQDRLVVNRRQESSISGVYGAGEVCGIAGVETALVEGQIAGYHAVGQDRTAQRLYRRRDRLRRFADRLQKSFALRDELRRVPEPDTIVCRCEDVTFDQVRDLGSCRAARLMARCGMGPCQGRVCGPALRFLFDWKDRSVRPPLLPTPAGVLCEEYVSDPRDSP